MNIHISSNLFNPLLSLLPPNISKECPRVEGARGSLDALCPVLHIPKHQFHQYEKEKKKENIIQNT